VIKRLVDFTITFDFAAQQRRSPASERTSSSPAEGVIFRNSGLLVEDISEFPPPFIDEAGPRDCFDSGGVNRVCAVRGA
jgi:hypothetical protein